MKRRTSPERIPEVDIKRVEAYLSEAARTWSDRLLEALVQQVGGMDVEYDWARVLSLGEQQLLAFARVFLREPGLVILDEASSRLDPATERRIEHAIDRLLQGRTAIVIAHRLATVQRVDQVLILDSRGVRELGVAADRVGPERLLAGQEFVIRRAQAVEVGARVER